VKILQALVLTAVSGAALAAMAPAAAETKIGVVDYGRLMEESPQAKAALDAIRAEFAPKQRDLQNLQVALKAKEDKLQKDGATMSADQRAAAEKDLRDNAREFGRRQQELQDDFNARRNEEMSRLQRTLIEEVRAYAKSQNFDLVLADGVIYANQSIDMTSGVLASLQSRAARPAAAAPPGPATPPAKPTGR
jgi:outer membrane protein